MRLTDKIELFEQGEDGYDGHGNPEPGVLVSLGMISANVSYQSVAIDNSGDFNLRTIEQLRVMLPPMDFDPDKHRVKWEGIMYQNDGPPMLRRRKGRTHHVTVALKSITDY